MRIKATKHAERRMAERSYAARDVLHVLEHFDMSMPGDGSAVKYVGTLPDGRRVAVILIRPLDVTKLNVVKTAHPVD